jgi:hypothetical protein
MLKSVQQLTILSVMSICVPAEPGYLVGIAVQLSQLDLIPTEGLFADIFTFDLEDEAHNHGLTPFFEFTGYTVMNSIISYGSTFLYLSGCLILISLLLTLKILSPFSRR